MEQKRRNLYLFILFFLSVALIEGALILYTRINPPAAAPKKEPKTIHLHLAKLQLLPKPKPKPTPIPKPPKPKPKPIVKPKPKPKPKKIIKPKTIKKRKPVHKKRTHRKKIKKATPPPKPVSTPPAPPVPEKTPPKASPAPPPKTIPARPITSLADRAAAASIRNAYLQKVREKIVTERYYPRRAKKLRHTGVVTIAFTILADGSIRDIAVVRRSRHRDLDRAAVKTLRRIGRFDPIPEALHTQTLQVSVPIRYILR